MPSRYRRVVGSIALAALVAFASPASAQLASRQSPNIDGAWEGVPWDLYLQLDQRFTSSPAGGVALQDVSTYSGVVPLPLRLAAGLRYSPSSRVVRGEIGEWEGFARWLPLAESTGAPIDLSLQAGYNGTAGSVDGELSLGRRLGPLKVLLVGRGMSDAFGTEETGFAPGGGINLMPLPGRVPVAIVGDAIWLFEPDRDDRWAWSAGVHIGLPLTPLALSVEVANTLTPTLQGATFPSDDVWGGIELDIAIPTGAYAGAYPSEPVPDATRFPEGTVAHPVQVGIDDYAFTPFRLVVAPGTTVVWTNHDSMVHTVSADSRSFDSGSIPAGGSYRLTFEKKGAYPYHCAPHPFMRGLIVVQ